MTAVLHVALNPVTGPWSVLRDLALAQSRSKLYSAVGIGVIHSHRWPASYDTELKNLGLPFFKAKTLQCFGTGQFLWQRLQKPPLAEWVKSLADQSGAKRVVVHFHNAWMSGVFLPLKPLNGLTVTCVSTIHGVNAELNDKPARRWLHRRMAARLPRYAVRLTSVDRSNLPLAERILGLNPALFTVVPNGVASDSGSNGKIWQGHGEFVVGQIGTVAENKGWRLAAEAVSQLRAAGVPIRLLIAGTGPEAAAAEQMAASSGGAVEYLGHVSQPRLTLLPQLHALSVLSRHEGLPMTLIEAMAAGVPAIATPVGGIPEAIDDGQTGFLISRDGQELAKALRQLYDNPDLWQRLSRAARAKFESCFDLGHVVKRYDAVYHSK